MQERKYKLGDDDFEIEKCGEKCCVSDAGKSSCTWDEEIK